MKTNVETKYNIGDIVYQITSDSEGYKIVKCRIEIIYMGITKKGCSNDKNANYYQVTILNNGANYKVFEHDLYKFEDIQNKLKEVFEIT